MIALSRKSKTSAAGILALACGAFALGSATASAAPYDTGTTARVTLRAGGAQSTAAPYELSVSTSGRYVGFLSTDPKLVAHDTNGDQPDFFLRDRVTGAVTLLSVDENGKQTPVGTTPLPMVSDGLISADGSRAAYTIFDGGDGQHGTTTAYVRDLRSGKVTALVGEGPDVSIAALSANGRFVLLNTGGLYSGTALDVYDTTTRTITNVYANGSDEGLVGGAAISADGRYVAFGLFKDPYTREPAGIVRWDRTTKKLTNVAQYGENPVMTPDGRFIAFDSAAAYGLPDTNKAKDVFRKDMRTKAIIRVSVGAANAQGNGASYPQSISDSGDLVAFTSAAANLVPGDTNKHTDVFVRQIGAKLTRRVDVSTGGAQANGGASDPVISGDGRHVLFLSTASTLVKADSNGVADGFVRETESPH